ncbi:MAG: cell division ATPase MinD [Candidatus Diapherotrites archaeon]|nr:cell division ATPase MinD [Candidatus Diapherotrites archaeon]
MARSIAIASGKGGVGKTTITANLGIALAMSNAKVLLIDADVAMANLSLIFKLQNSPITLHEVLMGEANIEDAIYSGPQNVEIIPSGLSLESYRRVDPERLKQAVSTLESRYDYILLDVPAGIERSTLAALASAKQALIITTPDSPSVADALKTKIVAQRLLSKPFGFIINMVHGEKGELKKNEISAILELPCYGIIPFDKEVRKTFIGKGNQPIILRKPDSPAAKAITLAANKISGKKVEPEDIGKGSIFSRILSIFKRKKI